jgi:hypothetical protein
MTAQPITVRIAEHDGEAMLDAQCMALLFGVELADIHALPSVNGATPLPKEWIRRGRRRAREAQAHTGSDAMLDGLRYWAARDHGAELTVVYDRGGSCIVRDAMRDPGAAE